MSEPTKLGVRCGPGARRDAIHVAVMPVVAGIDLSPGEWCLVDGEVANPASPSVALGVIDPFLPGKVARGERVYLLLRPGSISSLRHEWTHPAVDGEPVDAAKAAAMERLRQLAGRMGVTLEEMLDFARNFSETGEPEVRHSFERIYQHAEFWDDYTMITGESVSMGPDDYFFHCGGCS